MAGMTNDAPVKRQPSVAPDFETDWADFLRAFLAHDRDTAAKLAALVERHSENAMAHLARGYLLLLLARPELRPAAEDCLRIAWLRIGSDTLLQSYAVGLQAWLDGNPIRAVSHIETVIAHHPQDAFAVKLSHAIRFMLGDAAGMRRSLARVVSIYTPDIPFAGYIKGCYAFALEETGDYREAERMGHTAVSMEPNDAWGQHAVAHVLEMEGRAAEGLAWLGTARDSRCNNFAFHLLWHRALFLLELGGAGEALALYDDGVRADRTDDFRDVANAASLLQRLEIAGIDVGERWEELADIAERRIDDRQLAFADLHYVMALAGAGRPDPAFRLAQGLLAARGGRNAEISRDIAAPAASALIAFSQGQYGMAVRLLGPIMPLLAQVGGSHAQRDVFAQVWIESLVRSGHPQADAELGQRLKARCGLNAFATQRLNGLVRRPEVVAALSLTAPTQVH
jgi:tetratricopeptide (TPR) repeat protein